MAQNVKPINWKIIIHSSSSYLVYAFHPEIKDLDSIHVFALDIKIRSQIEEKLPFYQTWMMNSQSFTCASCDETN